ncbi:hypothetical protein SAMN05444920_1011071 [Nonomuraea solani]|uniref:Ig-like domain-containing protein n=1 Tax=Nonomuraea solani TaxID=1144553 RepID=A0A1H5W3H3_9ACTN|nr:hypothetical protein [Nonomuraea solani]SEF94042.1 hypothetical protein SAMN05444920_1011071 [Nonomuraea solani]
MRKSYKLALPAVLASGLLMLPAALTTSSASAATAGSTASMALTLTGGGCEGLARRLLCSVAFSGAVAPVAIRWFVNGGNIPAFNDRTFVSIGCQPGFPVGIRSVISDATGASVEFRTSPVCPSGNP